jgi:hypothetical protein
VRMHGRHPEHRQAGILLHYALPHRKTLWIKAKLAPGKRAKHSKIPAQPGGNDTNDARAKAPDGFCFIKEGEKKAAALNTDKQAWAAPATQLVIIAFHARVLQSLLKATAVATAATR